MIINADVIFRNEYIEGINYFAHVLDWKLHGLNWKDDGKGKVVHMNNNGDHENYLGHKWSDGVKINKKPKLNLNH